MSGTLPPDELRLGDLLQQLVNLVSHRPQGETLAIMNEASVTLQQVLLLNRLIRQEATTPSALAEQLNMSLPSVSQMLDRLVQLGLVERTEDPRDRRQKQLAATAAAKSLHERLIRVRAAEYGRGVARLSPGLRAEFADMLERVLGELRGAPEPAGNGTRRPPRKDAAIS
jgi:DNA-binding MarR family transcriptional regulator